MTFTPRGARSRRSRSLVGVAILTVTALTACSSDSTPEAEPSTSTTTTSPATTTTAAVAEPQIEAVAAYRAFWAAYLAAADPMNPDHPGLPETATGEQLKTVRSAFLAFRSAGHVIRGSFELAPKVVSFDGTSAQIRDCYDDGTGVFDEASGARQDVDDPRRHQVTATVVNVEGTWKVAAISHGGDGCLVG